MKKELLFLLQEFYKDFYEYKQSLPYPFENISPSIDYLKDWLETDGKFSFHP